MQIKSYGIARRLRIAMPACICPVCGRPHRNRRPMGGRQVCCSVVCYQTLTANPPVIGPYRREYKP